MIERKRKKHQDLYTSQTGSTLRLVLTFRLEAVAFNSRTDAPVRVKKKYSVHFIFITFFCLIYKFPTASVRVCVNFDYRFFFSFHSMHITISDH